MVESLMLIALGFLTATLFAIVAIQLAWRRAVTVTTQKMRGELSLDELQQTAERLTAAETALVGKDHEVAELVEHANELSARNAELENAIAAAGTDAQTLRDEISDLQTHYEEARAEAERRADELAALQLHADTLQSHVTALKERIVELETAASGEIDRQRRVETQLRSLGEKASHLVAEMNEIFGEAASPSALQAAITPTAAASHAAEPITPAPYPLEENGGGDMRELNAIKASLSNFSESPRAEFGGIAGHDTQDEDIDNPLPNERFLAERIKALEAGVAS